MRLSLTEPVLQRSNACQITALSSSVKTAPSWAVSLSRAEGKSWVWVGCTHGAFGGIWREKRVIILNSTLSWRQQPVKLTNWPRMMYFHGLAAHGSTYLLRWFCNALFSNCLTKHFHTGLMKWEWMKRLSIHQLQWHFMTPQNNSYKAL